MRENVYPLFSGGLFNGVDRKPLIIKAFSVAYSMRICPLRCRLMKSKIISVIGAISLGVGMFAFQGCYGPSYGGYAGPGYYAGPAPVVVGDYDERHAWHDRDWWVNNRRDWVNDHHKEWLAHKNEPQREVRASNDRDQNRR
jgi:hypothetical protein